VFVTHLSSKVFFYSMVIVHLVQPCIFCGHLQYQRVDTVQCSQIIANWLYPQPAESSLQLFCESFFFVLSSRLHVNLSELLQTACSRHFISPTTLNLLRTTRMSITLGSHYRQFTGYVICDLYKLGLTVKKAYKLLSLLIFFSVALRPNAGHGLLIDEVSRSHITTHHSR